jgi:hypothetical protein
MRIGHGSVEERDDLLTSPDYTAGNRSIRAVCEMIPSSRRLTRSATLIGAKSRFRGSD